jgi:uncharacterized membrane protein YciS (DUF1049 family)
MIYLAIVLTFILGFLFGWAICSVHYLINFTDKKDQVIKELKKTFKIKDIKKEPKAVVFHVEEPKTEEEKAIEREEKIVIKPMPK